jgi:hypothetical protein
MAPRGFRAFAFCLSAALLFSVPARAGDLKVGAAYTNITPPTGVPLAGYYHARGSDSVHDDLYSRAIALEKDGVKAALVSLDLITTRRVFVEKARALVGQQTGIPGGHVMISASHAHTGPILVSDDPDEVHLEKPHALAAEYVRGLPEQIVASVRLAHEQMRSARALGFTGHEESITFNRRFHMTDGSVGWNPGKMNPGIIKPAGPIDDEVPVVFFESLEKKPIATYVNYAVHLDNVGGLQISADLPYTLTESLARVLGPNHVTLWTPGCCGDLNHINVRWDRPQKGHANAARMGLILAGEVLRNWPSLEPRGDGPLQVRQRLVRLPIPEVSTAEVEAAHVTVDTLTDHTRADFMKLVKAHQVLDVHSRNGKPLEAEVQVITLGSDLAWVSLPGEVFVQLGLDLKLDSPFEQTIVAELTNGSVGYIPNRRAYPQGNYEVVSARCAEGSGEMLVLAAVDILKELHQSARSLSAR